MLHIMVQKQKMVLKMTVPFDNIQNYKYIPTDLWDTKCFACGKNNPHGLHMKFYTHEKRLFSQLLIPETKRGWDKLVHGGIISTVLDEIMAWTAIYLTKNIMLTKSISVDFINAVYTNTEIKLVGWIEQIKDQKEAVLKSELFNQKGDLCAKATGTYALFSTKLAKRLKLMDDESLKNFEIFLKSGLWDRESGFGG